MRTNTTFKIFFVLFLATLTIACKTSQPTAVPSSFPEFYKEGHRGTRGLMPENTIPSMIKAIEDGANVIEVDVYTSKDGKVIVTHDPAVNYLHTLDPSGKELTKEEGKKFIFHQMNYEDIRKFDVGLKPHKDYPLQKNLPAYIPLFSELIDSVEAYLKANNLPKVIYNIELKSSEKYDNTYNATPEVLVDAVMEVVNSKGLNRSRYYIQSFDMRPLQYIHKKHPKIALGFLTSSKNTFEENIKQLGFVPHMYSPVFTLVTPELVAKCRANNTRLIPWTVNTKEDMQRLIKMGVNGIITDFPNYLTEVTK